MSATIVPFIKDTVFGPDAVAIPGDAFDRACAASANWVNPPSFKKSSQTASSSSPKRVSATRRFCATAHWRRSAFLL
jgi:hypothetical protein